MATDTEILEVLGIIAEGCELKVPASTEEIWCQIFRKVDGEKLKGAVIAYLAGAKHRRLPMPGEIFKLIAKRAEARAQGNLADVRCRDCGELGLVLERKPHPRAEGVKYDVMVPCHCVLGEAKVAYLERERRRG